MTFFEYIEFAANGGSYKDWLIVWGFGLGFILGGIVLACGLFSKKTKLAIIGFFAVLLGNAGIGLILGGPLMGVFLWLILKPKKDELLDAEEEDELKDIELDESDFEEKK